MNTTSIWTNWVGRIAMDLVAGDETLTSADTRLRKAVEEFNSTLAHFSHGVGFQTFAIGSQTLDAVHGNALQACPILISL